MKKIIINIFCILLLIFSVLNIAIILGDSFCEEIIFMQDSISVYGADKLLIDEKYIYIGDSIKNSVQVFNHNGDFIYRVKIPTNGGDFWMGIKNNKIYIYAVRKNVQYEISGNNSYEATDNIYYGNPDIFYKQFDYNYGGNIRLTLSGKIEISQNKSDVKYIDLDVPFFGGSIALVVYFVLLIVSIISLIMINHIFIEALNDIKNSTERMLNLKNRL